MSRFDWPRFLADEVLPALFDRLDQAFPEFGWRRKGDSWNATDDGFTHGQFGCRPDRVFVNRGDYGFGIAGGDGWSWIDYVGGRGCRGEQFIAAVKNLAGRCDVPVPTGEETPEEAARIAAHQAEMAAQAEQRRLEAEAERATNDAEAITKARALWDAGSEAHAAVVAYFAEQRGIDIRSLPEWPWALRYGPMYHRKAGHAVLCAAVDAAGEFRGLQRIGIGPTGVPIRNDKGEKVKEMAGRPAGGAVHFAGSPGMLVLCEGVETGLAIRVATGASVACVLSAGFYRHYTPPAEFDTLVIAADHDRSGAGQGHADEVCDQWRAGGRKVQVALPDHVLAPSLFAADHGPLGKSVDWLDVYRLDPELVRQGIAEAARTAVAAEENDWGELKIMPENDLDRARWFLLDHYAPPRGRRAHRGLGMITIAGAPYVYNGTAWRYLPQRGDAIRRDVRQWAADDWHELRVVRKGGESRKEPRRLVMSKTSIEATVAACMDETMVLLDDDQSISRMWLRPMFDARGRAQWDVRPWDRIDQGNERPDAANVIALSNGLLDVEAWKKGTTRLMPHTELFFNTTVAPWELPRIAEKISDGELEEIIDELCPEWLEVLATKLRAADDSGEQVRELQKWFGYVLTTSINHQYGNILMLVGPPGTGKTTISTVLENLVGLGNVVHSRLDKLVDGPHMASWIGKPLAIFEEANAGTRSDKELSAEILKAISGGGRIPVRRLYEGELPPQQMVARILMLVNEPPDLPDRSRALERRMIVMDVSVKHGREDTGLVDRLLAPRSMGGVLLWSLLGLRYLERDGAFRQPAAGQPALDVFMANASVLEEFVEEYLVFDDVTDEDWESSRRLYEVFLHYWMHDRQRKEATAMSDTQFFRQVLGLFKAHGYRGKPARRGGVDGYAGLRMRLVPSLGYASAPGPQ